MADPFDEFEFKPLTEGLGFHKKAEKIKHDIKETNLGQEHVTEPGPEIQIRPPSISSSLSLTPEPDLSLQDRPASQSISDLIASLPPSLDFLEEKQEPSSLQDSVEPPSLIPSSGSKSSLDSLHTSDGRPQIFQPLARDEYSTPVAGPTLGSFLPNPGAKIGSVTSAGMGAAPLASSGLPSMPSPTLPGSTPSLYREKLDESFARAFPHAEKTKKETTSLDTSEEALQPVSANLAAGILDAMVTAGISTILLVCILAITRINLIGMLSNAHTGATTQFQLALLFLAVLQIYMLTARSMFGASLGEWAFDLQVGSDDEQRRVFYPLQVAWRMVVVTATGIIVLPVLSLIVGRDLTKYVTGLQLYRRP